MKNDLPKIALGAWAWGNDGTFGDALMEESVKPVFDEAMKNGLNLWDTAFAYGMGASEKTLGSLIQALPRTSYIISDKLTPQCIDANSDTPVADMLDVQCKFLGIDDIDIYWIHNPFNAPHWTEEIAKYFEGKEYVPMLGVSNHNLEEIKEAKKILEAHGLKLGAVQNHYSLLNRSSEDSGILDFCNKNDIVFFSYMVLEQGALTGKYNSQNPMPDSDRAAIYNPMMEKLETLNAELKTLADKYNVDIAQIPIAWAIGKGTLPIVGVTKVHHITDAINACSITLTDEEIRELEKLADSLELNVIRYWEKTME